MQEDSVSNVLGKQAQIFRSLQKQNSQSSFKSSPVKVKFDTESSNQHHDTFKSPTHLRRSVDCLREPAHTSLKKHSISKPYQDSASLTKIEEIVLPPITISPPRKQKQDRQSHQAAADFSLVELSHSPQRRQQPN